MSSRACLALAFLLAFPVVAGAAADEAIRSQFATVNGVKLHYLQAGGGTEHRSSCCTATRRPVTCGVRSSDARESAHRDRS